MAKMDLKNFKKVASDAKSTTLKHPGGHTIIIAHAMLSPKMKADMDALPVHKADGGSVDKGPKIDQQKAQQMQDSVESTRSLGQLWNNIKESVQPSPSPKASPTYAQGGQVADDTNSNDVTQDMPQNNDGVLGAIKDAYTQAKNAFATGDAKTPPEAAPQQPEAPVNPQQQAIQQFQMADNLADKTKILKNYNDKNNGTPDQIAAYNEQAQKAGLPGKPMPQDPNAPAPDPYGVNRYGQVYGQGINEQKAGIFGEAQAQQALAHKEQAALQQQAAQQQQQMKSYQDHYSELDNERKALTNDIKNSRIDPNHFVSNLSTGDRILTVIGSILGGMGGNDHVVKDLIDRDIDAQKANLGTKENLLSANFKAFGNMKDATEMTRIMQNDYVSNQLKQAAAKTNDQFAKARALQSAGKLDMESAGQQSQIAMRQTLLGGMKAGKIAPERVIKALVPENEQGAYFKELKEAQDTVRMRDNVLSTFDQLAQIDTLQNRGEHFGFTPPQVRALREPLLAQLSKDTAGRFTEADAKMIEPLLTMEGKNQQSVDLQRRQLNDLLAHKMHFPQLKYYGIDVDSMGRYSGQGKSNITELPATTKKR